MRRPVHIFCIVKYRCFCLVFFAVCAYTLHGQLQSPDDYLPHRPGERFTLHHLIVDYFQHVAEHSPRVVIKEYGRTYEGRPLIRALISTPANLQRQEEIRINNLKMAGLEEGRPNPEDVRAIVWLSCSVHGNEPAASEASMRILHALATGRGDTGMWLENTLVILDPSLNPDGYNRYTSWSNQVSVKSSDPNVDSREHNEPWPGGRGNHYLFDLNRDWVWQTQVESALRVSEYQRWMPHVHADLHEMSFDSPYYFAPAAEPYHVYISEWQRSFQDEIGKHHATYFDRYGWRYFTKETFDLLYPAYGDTYPLFNGAIGMTYEQGGHSRAGRAVVLANGDTLTLEDRLNRHAVTALSTVEVSSKHAHELLRNFEEYFSRAQRRPRGKYKTYVIKSSNPEGRKRALCRLLDRQGIRYGYPVAAIETRGFHYTSGREEAFTVDPDDLVVSAYQPRSVLVQVLFDPDTEMADSLTYDITSWALPFAYGLDGFATETRVQVSENDVPSADRDVPEDAYAYVMPWTSMVDAQFLAAALKTGLHARVAGDTFRIGTRTFQRGTVLFMQADHKNTPDFNVRLAALRQQYHAELIPVRTGYVETGKDFGSDSYGLVRKPAVLTIAGEGVSATGFGEIWHFFEQRLDYPLTIVDKNALGHIDLSEYNVVVMPAGRYRLDQPVIEALQKWVRDGGKVIAIGSALRIFEDKEGFALKKFAHAGEANEEKQESDKEQLNERLLPYADRARRTIAHRIPGTIFRAQVDRTHPLSYGFGTHYFTLKTIADAYAHLTDATNAVYLDDKLLYFGFAGSSALEDIRGSIVFAEERQGRGVIVYMVDNPLFRGFWEIGHLAFCNALFFCGN